MNQQKHVDQIERFKKARGLEELEELADALGDLDDLRSTEALLSRLGDDQVQEERDAEDAVGGSLVKLGVMQQLGNLNYTFRSLSILPKAVVDAITKYREWIPQKYFQG